MVLHEGQAGRKEMEREVGERQEQTIKVVQ